MHMVIVVPKTKYLERRFYLYCFVHEKDDNMKIEKIKTILLTCLMILLYCGIFTKVKGADRIYFYGKLQNGKNIYYWIDQNCQYTVAIPQAVKKLRYPKGMWNPIVLNRTTNKPSSKMDLYQYKFPDGQKFIEQRLMVMKIF